MSERTYFLALDAGIVDLERIRKYITTGCDLTAWWIYIRLVFLVASNLKAETMGERLHSIAPTARF